MDKITIGFSKSKKSFAIGSWLIRLYQHTPYSHVYLKFYSKTTNRQLIYEAVGGGVRFIGSNAWEKHAVEMKTFDINITHKNTVELMQYCIDNAGCEYGFLQNLGIAFCNAFGIKKNPFKKGKNCSEIIAEILILEGCKINKDLNLITPKDIYEILDEIESKKSKKNTR